MVERGATDGRSELEEDIRRLLGRGAFESAASMALRGYGAEIFGFLLMFHRDREDAEEVYCILSERMWRGLRSFRFECSFRTWMYTLARHGALNYRRDAQRRNKRYQSLPEGSELSAIAAQARSETPLHLKSSQKNAFAALRQSLPLDDQTLLVLRLDRQLPWKDIARVLHSGEAAPAEDELDRESARLRKRFENIKKQLLDMGRHAGLLAGDR